MFSRGDQKGNVMANMIEVTTCRIMGGADNRSLPHYTIRENGQLVEQGIGGKGFAMSRAIRHAQKNLPKHSEIVQKRGV